MDDKDKSHYDLTEEASKRDTEEGTSRARQAESDDLYEGSGVNITPSPEGDSAAENKVATSLSDD